MTESFTHEGRTIRIETHLPAASGHKIPAIILLHGSGGNTGWWLDRIAPQITSAGIALFAPHYFDATGIERADWATITDGTSFPQWLASVRATLDHVAARPDIDTERIAFVGVSLGAFLSLALAAQLSASPETADRIRCVVDLSGGLADPWRSEATSAFPPTLIVHGEADDVVHLKDAKDLIARFTDLGVEHETMLLPNEGHWFSQAARLPLFMRLANFLSKHLKP